MCSGYKLRIGKECFKFLTPLHLPALSTISFLFRKMLVVLPNKICAKILYIYKVLLLKHMLQTVIYLVW